MMDDVPQRLVDRTQSYADGINAYIDHVQGPGAARDAGRVRRAPGAPDRRVDDRSTRRASASSSLAPCHRATAASFATRSRSPTPARRRSSGSFPSARTGQLADDPALRGQASPRSPAAPAPIGARAFASRRSSSPSRTSRASSTPPQEIPRAAAAERTAGRRARRGPSEHPPQPRRLVHVGDARPGSEQRLPLQRPAARLLRARALRRVRAPLARASRTSTA